MKLRILVTLSLGATLACGSSASTPGSTETSTGDIDPASGSTGGSTGASSVQPDPTGPPPTSTGTGGSSSTDDTNSSSGSDCGFVACADVPSDSGFDCDIFLQDCARGEKCAPWANDGGNSWNATRCYPIVDDPAQPGEPCTVEGEPASGLDSCDLGSMCWDVDAETDIGVCTPHCIGSPGDPACEDSTRVCSIGGDSILALCLPTCDPLMDSCDEGEGCYPWEQTFICAPDTSGEGGGPFETCEFTNGCDPGAVCVPGEVAAVCDSTNCCTPFCSLEAPDCPDTMICFPWSDEETLPPTDDVGYCADAGWDGG